MAKLDDIFAPHILDWMYSEGFDEVTISDRFQKPYLTVQPRKKVQAKVKVRARKWKGGHYVISRKAHTFFRQLGNNCTSNSQSCTR